VKKERGLNLCEGKENLHPEKTEGAKSSPEGRQNAEQSDQEGGNGVFEKTTISRGRQERLPSSENLGGVLTPKPNMAEGTLPNGERDRFQKVKKPSPFLGRNQSTYRKSSSLGIEGKL